MNQVKPVIIILGPQGSGKGTQGKRLAKKLEIPYLETGQLLRDEAELDTERGKFFASIINHGGHLEDKDINAFMQDKIKQAYDSSGGCALDGYPRSEGQAEASDSVAKPTHVLLIDIPDEESIRRLSARRRCPKDGKIYNMVTAPPKNNETCDDCGEKLEQRDDDTPNAIQKRLDWYHKDTQPLIDRYEKLGVLHKIDGMPDIPEVEKLVWSVFSPSS
jgi:adenylate kinase|tara:strand:- start:1686 stop:2339 length:654 start_codon:yes stop_codon:yes gene_type:complete